MYSANSQTVLHVALKCRIPFQVQCINTEKRHLQKMFNDSL